MVFEAQSFEKIAEEFDLKLLLLFGSQVSGETHVGSDFDFAYQSGHALDYGERAKLRIALSNLVGHPDAEETDVREAGPFLLREIIRNHAVLFSRGDSYERFYSYAVRSYLEESRIFSINEALYRGTADKYRSYAQ